MKTKKAFMYLILFMWCFWTSALVGETLPIPPSNFSETNAGTESNPFLISNLSNLRWLSETQTYWGRTKTDSGHTEIVRYYFSQTADIDAYETQYWNNGFGFEPIGDLATADDGEGGTYSAFFYGSYNGNLYKISNLHFALPLGYEQKVLGLFGAAQYADIINVIIENVSILNPNIYTGALIGFAFGGNTILNCSSSGDIIANEPINTSHFSAIGGLIGRLSDTSLGGMFQCYSTVNIEIVSNFLVGGLIGEATHTAKIHDSFFKGNITNLNRVARVGGLFGNVSSNEVRNSYVASTGTNNMGGITFGFDGADMAKCFWDMYTTGTKAAYVIKTPSSGPLGYVEGWTTKQMKTVSRYIESANWDFENIWAINEYFNDGYPFLRVLHPDIPHIPYEPEDDIIEPPDGAPSNFYEPNVGSAANPYLISNLPNLKWMSERSAQWWKGENALVHFIQTNDIDAAETIGWNDGAGFRPIGYLINSRYRFVGVYDGNRYTISNLYIDFEGDYDVNAGLFSYVTNNSIIKNIGLVNFNITGSQTSGSSQGAEVNVGGIVGFLDKSTIFDSYAKGIVNASSRGMALAGGVVGIAWESTISNCYAYVDVNALDSPWSFAGGITGELYRTTSMNNFASGNFAADATTNAFASGIAGNVELSTISNNYATGLFYANSANSAFVGGIAAQVFRTSDITNSYAICDIYAIGTSFAHAGGVVGQLGSIFGGSPSLISNSYVTGGISAVSTSVFSGGIVGRVIDNSSILRCFWDIETTGQSHAINSYTPPTNFGLTTIEMKRAENYINNGWDFIDIWGIHPSVNDGYPCLRSLTDIPDIEILPVSDLAAEVDGSTVNLSWNTPNSFPIGYNIARGTVAFEILPHTQTTFIEYDVPEGKHVYAVKAIYINGISEPVFVEIEIETMSDGDDPITPLVTELKGNFPNPFNPETFIKFSLKEKDHTKIDIFNIKGQKVKTLLDSVVESGEHTVIWNGRDDFGRELAGGVYLYRMATSDMILVRRMVLLK